MGTLKTYGGDFTVEEPSIGLKVNASFILAKMKKNNFGYN
jgi:hypothetical protein